MEHFLLSVALENRERSSLKGAGDLRGFAEADSAFVLSEGDFKGPVQGVFNTSMALKMCVQSLQVAAPGAAIPQAFCPQPAQA